ncbi:hypothetical protein TPHA_0G00270 [Tetrapisispora phaffii CBS 4417]|uniref:Transcription factor IIIA n=1 Tax=Tetrapisispora phaffii (strain ATCC 24235 / CBS 4417 / NBRC 1672 / NRRL Y-8282 / UCD 70-5) TaxID=1071381 RepID=G8BVD7_TETPH|nr:hypothetical protein TPHA_0G00270 [Tetrapisispora phaffii CBS 4417]CCE63865.1 hypothetical protein TPHA_0G00270 [Tetrapisispora phaffii CBS 4417]
MGFVSADSEKSDNVKISLWRSESTARSSSKSSGVALVNGSDTGTDDLDDGGLSDVSVSSIDSFSSSSSTSSRRIKKYFCEYDGCNKSFARPSTLTEHQQSIHLGIKNHSCDVCGSKFSRKSHLERHLISHSAEKPFHCSFCDKGLTTRQQLKRHEITHSKSFQCTFEGCAESFYKHPQLRAHVLSVHLEKLKCQFCGKSFQRPYRLKNHLTKHHNPEVENPYPCSYNNCTKNFKTWTALQRHLKNDHPKVRCEVCDKPCVGESGLKMHMKIHDDKLVIKNWKCNICEHELLDEDLKSEEKSFAKKNELLNHYRKEHNDHIPDELLIDFNTDEDQIFRENDVSVSNRDSSGIANHNNFDTDDNNVRKKRKLTDSMIILNEEKLGRCINGDDMTCELALSSNNSDLRNYETKKGTNALSLLMDTVGRKLSCYFPGCRRTFKTKERFDKHISKHNIHQLKLKIALEKEQGSKENK